MEDVIYCSKHPKVETALTCASCGIPICPKCMVSTPVGMKCRDCGTAKQSPLYKIGPGRFLLAGIVALLAGMAGSLVGSLGFFIILLSIPYGYFAGNLVLRASGMKRGLHLEILAGSAIVIGNLLARVFPALLFAAGTPEVSILSLLLPYLAHPFYLLSVGIIAACAVSKIRYL